MCGSAENQNTLLRAVPPEACLTTEELAEATGLTRKQVTQAVGKLVARGLLDRAERGCFKRSTAGQEVVDSGQPLSSAPLSRSAKTGRRKRSLRVRVWEAIRTARKGTVAEIEQLALASEKDPGGVQRYLLALRRGGYLRRMKAVSYKEARYLLIRDTGPLAPILRRSKDCLYDPNTKEEHVLEGGGV
jgi:predicted transcriptional regulator of viral defense system